MDALESMFPGVEYEVSSRFFSLASSARAISTFPVDFPARRVGR